MYGIHLYESKHRDGDVVEEHHHEKHQFLYALDGKGVITLDGLSLDFEQNSGVVITPYSKHAIVSNMKLTVLVLAFDETLLDSAVRQQLLHDEFGRSKLIKLGKMGDNELRQMLRKMLFEQSQGGPLNVLALPIYLAELLLVLVRNESSLQAHNVNGKRAEKLRQYIETHYFEIFSSHDIAVKLGVSARHINNIFKEQYHVTPLQYLTEVRMELAKKMLSETDKDISSVCFEVGFESLSTFYRIFRNSEGIAPNSYRKLQHEETITSR
jgi:AraC-like DNA-binding protein